ncbi:hypothetical protein ZIOFF_012919 [Zingiber officinale]|uniref:Uncharacterized protein n=1 Tax=Zingiber officinale TaxID=94328 RepID=A0A8J5LTS0_ZINOF|nr:hypothetical protein ZIOFF_012919 [Zingiber officinale]
MRKMSLNSAILLYTACKVVPLIVTPEQHFLKYDEVGSWAWAQDYALMLMLSKEVPWFLESLIADLCNRWYQITSPGFTVVGIFLLAKHAVQHVLEKRRCWELQKRVLTVARQARNSGGRTFANLEKRGESSAINKFMPYGNHMSTSVAAAACFTSANGVEIFML